MKRRTFLLSSILTALAAGAAETSPVDPKETFVPRHNDIKFAPWNGLPPGMKKQPVAVRIEPAVFGIGPADIELADPHLPSWRRV